MKQGTGAILVAAIASPYLSRQVSAFRRFRQFLLPISCRLYMQAVDAGYEELPQSNYPTLLHISCRYKNVDIAVSTFLK